MHSPMYRIRKTRYKIWKEQSDEKNDALCVFDLAWSDGRDQMCIKLVNIERKSV